MLFSGFFVENIHIYIQIIIITDIVTYFYINLNLLNKYK